MTNAEDLRRRRAIAKENGLCRQCCCRPVSPGLATCDVCLVKQRERRGGVTPIGASAKAREAHRAEVYQRKLDRDRARSRLRRIDPAQRARDAAASKVRYYQKKLAGLCVHCGAGLQEDDSVSCVDCTERKIAWDKSRKGRKSIAATKRRIRAKHLAEGRCVDCLQPHVPSRIRCAECLAAMVVANTKSREAKREREKAGAA